MSNDAVLGSTKDPAVYYKCCEKHVEMDLSIWKAPFHQCADSPHHLIIEGLFGHWRKKKRLGV